MRCVIQRVAQASVSVDGEQIGAIQQGFMVLIGVSTDDTDHDVHYMAEKVPNLRIFEDEAGKMNRHFFRHIVDVVVGTSKPDVSARICRCRSSTTAL